MTEYTDKLDQFYTEAKANRAAGKLWEVILIDDEFGQLPTTDDETFTLKESAQAIADKRNREDTELEEGQTWQVRPVAGGGYSKLA